MEKKPRFNVGQEVYITSSASYFAGDNLIGTTQTIQEGKWIHGYYFYDRKGDVWLCIGRRNVREKDVKIITKLEKALK